MFACPIYLSNIVYFPFYENIHEGEVCPQKGVSTQFTLVGFVLCFLNVLVKNFHTS